MTGSIPNYVCITCGRGFTSARSARRHIATVENGYGNVLTEADYRTSILTGMILPPIPKSLRPKRKTFDVPDIAFQEYTKGLYWRLGAKKAETLTPQEERQMIAVIQQKLILETLKK